MAITTGQDIEAGDFVGTSAGAADVGKVPKLDSERRLDPSFIYGGGETYVSTTGKVIDGSTTPVPITIDSNGKAIISDANGTGTQAFHGFVTEDYSGDFETPDFVNGGSLGDSATVSLTANAGNDRVLVVVSWAFQSGSASPTGYTWNGEAMTSVLNSTTSNGAMRIFVLPIGDSETNQTADLVRSGGSHFKGQLFAVYDNVNQTTPVDSSDNVTGGTGGTFSFSPVESVNRVVAAAVFDPNFTTSGWNTRATNAAGGSGPVDIGDAVVDTDTAAVAWSASNNGDNNGVGVVLNGVDGLVTEVPIEFQYEGILAGFSGLTPGARYYVSNTAGVISATPGSTSILVGKAFSETELLILQ